MKKRITRLSPHQNGKIVGALMASVSFLILTFVSLVVPFFAPSGDPRPLVMGSWPMLIWIPVVYFIFGYLTTLVASGIYNVLVKHIGGFEFEVEDERE